MTALPPALPTVLPTVLLDIGGVLVTPDIPAFAARWADRLRCTEEDFLAAVFGGNDDQVAVGRVSEREWWETVRRRLGVSGAAVARIERDMTSPLAYDPALVSCLRELRRRRAARTGLLSNAWPHARRLVHGAGVLDAVDDVVLSCEAGYGKPDPRIFTLALERLGAEGPVLFVDDTPRHVRAARDLGLEGHVHTDRDSTLRRIADFVKGGETE